jgi:hypothetical protein
MSDEQNNGGLEEIFNMVSDSVTSVVPERASSATPDLGKEVDGILDSDPPEGSSSEIMVVEIDAKRAANLNKYVQRGLGRLYEMAGSAAERLCNQIESGDTDARTIEGTARLVESATKAMSEINRYNMFLQEQMVDMRVRNEIEKLRLRAEKQRTETTREALLKAVKEIKEDVQSD